MLVVLDLPAHNANKIKRESSIFYSFFSGRLNYAHETFLLLYNSSTTDDAHLQCFDLKVSQVQLDID